MSNTYLFEKVIELKEKFFNLFQHKKKVRALENYSNVAPFHHKKYLRMIESCIDDGFLEEKEAEFLDHMLGKYEVNYLDWSHKTPWLKRQMEVMAEEQESQKIEQFQLPFRNMSQTSYNVPTHLLTNQNKHQNRRI